MLINLNTILFASIFQATTDQYIISFKKQFYSDFDAHVDSVTSLFSTTRSGVSNEIKESTCMIQMQEKVLTDFGGRAKWGADFIPGSPNIDKHRYGTRCAGNVGFNTYGVAKKANLIPVKVLGQNGQVQNSKGRSAVISISIAGDRSWSVNQAAADAVNSEIFVVSAAGNENRDACLVSPASLPRSFTVGATDIYDRKASLSNWGRYVLILAPGVDVISTVIGRNSNTQYMSRTSMTCTHVAGLASQLLSQGVPFHNLKNTLLNMGTKNAIGNFW